MTADVRVAPLVLIEGLLNDLWQLVIEKSNPI